MAGRSSSQISLCVLQIQDARMLLKHAEEANLGIRFTPGAVCGGDAGCIRLCSAFYSPEELKLGVSRLARAIETYMRAHGMT